MSARVTVSIAEGSPLIVGQYASGTSVGYDRRTGAVLFTATWDGTYTGQGMSEGEPYHYFRDGHINGTRQPHHGFPVSQVVPA